MKTYLNILILILLPVCGFAQHLNNAKTYQKTVELAQKKQKPILLIITIKPPANFVSKVQPNEALKEEDVVKKMKENLLFFKVSKLILQ